MKVAVGLVFTLLHSSWMGANGQSLGFSTCDEQAACIDISRRQLISSGICAYCAVEVCLTINFSGAGCSKTGTIDHICTRSDEPSPNWCLDSPYNMNYHDKQTNVGDGTVYCAIVVPGDEVIFFLSDGVGTCTSMESTPASYDLPTTSSCVPATDSNYDFQPWLYTTSYLEIESCTNTEETRSPECLWRVTTADLFCPPPKKSQAGSPTFPPTRPRSTPSPAWLATHGNGGSAGGDPHIRTWTGEKFDYHGACDLVLVRSEGFADGLGLDIHMRTKHRGSFSYITSAALRIGSEVFEVTGKLGIYYLNSVANVAMPATIAGYQIVHKQRSDHESTFLIKLHHGQTIVFKTWRDIVSVVIEHATLEDFDDAVGLMGDFVTGHRFGRDGTIIDDVNAYGQDWQVRSDELKLFQTVEAPQYPQHCLLPSPVKDNKRRRLGEGISEAVAKAVCADAPPKDFDFCVFDVMSTNDIEAADIY
jgi:hypothetical protein